MPGARAEERPLTRDINESLSPGEVVFPLACGQEETLCQTGRGNGARAVATTGPLTQTADAQVDVYITPGKHTVNGRQWSTTWAYSSNVPRCRTEIWATQVAEKNGRYVTSNGWVFNNLTYKASPRRPGSTTISDAAPSGCPTGASWLGALSVSERSPAGLGQSVPTPREKSVGARLGTGTPKSPQPGQSKEISPP